MMTWLYVLTGAVGVVVAAGLVMARIARGNQNARRAQRLLAEAFPGKTALRWELANGSGIQEPNRLRGDGVLALYDDALVFVKLTSRDATRIPLGDISDVTRIRAIESFMEDRDAQGATSTPEWSLKLEWKSDGKTEAAAWTVFDADDWIAALARARL